MKIKLIISIALIALLCECSPKVQDFEDSRDLVWVRVARKEEVWHKDTFEGGYVEYLLFVHCFSQSKILISKNLNVLEVNSYTFRRVSQGQFYHKNELLNVIL